MDDRDLIIDIHGGRRRGTKDDGLIYGRTSTDGETSLATQVSECRKKADQTDVRVRYVLTDDAESSEDDERPGLLKMLEHAQAHHFKVLLVWKLDRLGRTLAGVADVERELAAQGIGIISATEPVDTTTPVGRFVFGILASHAQLELSNIRERTRTVQQKLRKEGRWIHGPPPLGYRKGRGHFLRVYRPEATLVQEVFATFLSEASYARTAYQLNAKGSSCRGHEWTASRVRCVIQNPLYAGSQPPAVKAPAIVTPDIRDRALQLARRNVHRGSPHRRMKQAAIRHVFDQYVASLKDLDGAV